MKEVRVLVANQPRLMREAVLAAVSKQPDIKVVGEVSEEAEILAALERTEPDFLIIALGASDERPSICDFVLEGRPQLRVLAIAPNRDTAIFYWVSGGEICASRVDTSEQGVLSALRSGL